LKEPIINKLFDEMIIQAKKVDMFDDEIEETIID
jgi:hypothetical protein